MTKELVEKVNVYLLSQLDSLLDDCDESWRYEYDCEAGQMNLAQVDGYLSALVDAGLITERKGDLIKEAFEALQEKACCDQPYDNQKETFIDLVESLED